jgi:HK97 family phage prohead protease
MSRTDRAYSLLDIKSVDEELRIIEGWATTPKVDRMGDVVEPLGITAAPTIPLLLHHDSRLPVGTVTLGKPTKKGVPFTARLPKVAEPGALQDRVNEAWQMVKYRLIAATSIGFRVLEDAIERIDTGFRFLKTEVMELSLVAIPAQDEAVITAFKSYCAGEAGEDVITAIKTFDAEACAASGVDTQSEEPSPAAPGQEQALPERRSAHVVKLHEPACARAPFVIRKINHLR